MKQVTLLITVSVLVLAGCGSKDESTTAETKSTDVKQNIDSASQDRIASSLKTWKPVK